MSSYDVNLQALRAFGDGTTVTAHNLANSNTDQYRSLSHTYTSGPGRDSQNGVQLNVQQQQDFGQSGDRVSLSFMNETAANPGETSATSTAAMNADAAGLNRIPSDVDPGREMTSLISDQRAFEANAAAITTRSDMDASLLGMVVNTQV